MGGAGRGKGEGVGMCEARGTSMVCGVVGKKVTWIGVG